MYIENDISGVIAKKSHLGNYGKNWEKTGLLWLLGWYPLEHIANYHTFVISEIAYIVEI